MPGLSWRDETPTFASILKALPVFHAEFRKYSLRIYLKFIKNAFAILKYVL